MWRCFLYPIWMRIGRNAFCGWWIPQLLQKSCQKKECLSHWDNISQPFGVQWHFHRGHLRPQENPDIYSSKITVVATKVVLRLGVTPTWETVSVDPSARKAENGCASRIGVVYVYCTIFKSFRLVLTSAGTLVWLLVLVFWWITQSTRNELWEIQLPAGNGWNGSDGAKCQCY